MPILQLKKETLALLEEQLEGTDHIGVDTEFHAERRFIPLLLLIQIQVPSRDTWIIDATQPGLFLSLKHQLMEKVWVVHGGRYDLILLHNLFGALPERVWDTQIIAGTIELYYPSRYGRLLKQHLDLSLPKQSTLSNWARRPLTPEQIQYAAEDVLHLMPLWEKILQKARVMGRLELAESLCMLQRQHVIEPESADTLYRHHHVLQHLGEQEAAIFQELIAWRHRIGKANNQPPRSVLNDGIVIELSRRQPMTIDALSKDRRMPKRVIAMHGDALIEQIQRAAQRPAWGWPKRVAAYSLPWVQRRLIDGYLAKDGYQYGYSPKLLFPSHLLDSLVVEEDQTEAHWSKKIEPTTWEFAGKRLWKFFAQDLLKP